jgi:predicted enzyme related to lactoylglutathione lyase
MTADMGAAGFEDVVAAIQLLAADMDDAPAHWGVQFSTDDADRTAAKAAELGGEVLAQPTDVPWARITVLKDPQGATFTASKFVPENADLAS